MRRTLYPDFEGLREQGRAIRDYALSRLDIAARNVRSARHRARRPCALGARCERSARDRPGDLAGCRRQDRHQRQIHGDGRNRAQSLSRSKRPRADRDRSRRIHHPAASRAAQPHHRAGVSSEQRRCGRNVSRRAQDARSRPQSRRAHGTGGGGARHVAGRFRTRRRRHHGRQFSLRRRRRGRHRHQRRQWRSDAASCRARISSSRASRKWRPI